MTAPQKPKYEATDPAGQPDGSPAVRYKPASGRTGTALCLSGGGFRATLFHLGALRRLNEIGLLAKLDTVSSVSGGSIMAAFLATRLPWPLTGPLPAETWERDLAEPVRRFAKQNVRTPAMLRRLLAPWNDSAGVRGLMAIYRRRLSDAKLSALPERPRFIFCATDLCFGVNFVFERGRVGDYRLGYLAPPPPDWEIARAVAASSCFPPIFNPLPLDVPAGGFKSRRWGDLRSPDVRLSDGGLYDNLGLEPVWKTHRAVLVSDGGAVFTSMSDGGLFARIGRYVDIVDNQALALRKRWLISSFLDGTMNGSYWGIGSETSSYARGGPGYSEEVVDEIVAPIRTDLDAFSDAEMAALENHGYTVAAAAAATHLGALAIPDSPAPTPPHPAWMDEGRVRLALANSGKRKLLGRFS
jgi:NTE family protein